MVWGGIIGNAIIGPFRVPEGLKLSSATYCPILKNSLEPWLDNLPLATLKKIIFMHDNALSQAAKATTQFLHSLGFVNDGLASKLTRFEPSRELVVNNKASCLCKQYSSKDDL